LDENELVWRWDEAGADSRTAAVFASDGQILRTRGDIEAESRRFECLLEGEGVVGVQTGNHAGLPALLLACWRSGRAVCLLDPQVSGGRLERLERALGVSARVSAGSAGLDFAPLANPPVPVPPGVCLFKLTSGTTGEPKAIGFKASQLAADCDQVCETMGIGGSDLNFGLIPFSHSYGFSNLVTPLICRGIPMVASGDGLPRAVESALHSTRASVLPMVPAMFRALLSLGGLPGCVRLCVSAGAPLDPSLAMEFHAKFGRKIHSFYGASECGGICFDDSPEIVEEAGYVGKPLAGVRIDWIEKPSGSGARICVRSEAVGERVSEEAGSFIPQDLLVPHRDGYRIIGRESDFINVAGQKIHPAAIEEVLRNIAGVSEVFVFSRTGGARGEEICAAIAGKPAISAEQIRSHCAFSMPPLLTPRRILIFDEIPRNHRGKYDREFLLRVSRSE